MGIRLFWLECTNVVELSLRRSGVFLSEEPTCPLGGWHRRSSGPVGRRPAVYRYRDDGVTRDVLESIDVADFADSPWWPRFCECGYAFADDDPRYVDQAEVLVDADGVEYVRRGHGDELPHGAVFEAWWLNGMAWAAGNDGISLIVVVPEQHPWMVDSQASNCDRRCPWVDDDAKARHPEHAAQHRDGWCDPGFRNHKCWVRVGDPRRPETLHVSKDGETCSAGAGSILTPEWHGFLRNGELVT